MSYKEIPVTPSFNPAQTMAVAFQDQRPAVLEGLEKQTFCGHLNSTAQISYNVQTEDGLPLAQEFAEALSKSMQTSGYSVMAVTTQPAWPADSVMAKFNATDKQRLLYFTIRKWESRSTPLFSTIRYEVLYDLGLEVYDRSGAVLSTTSRNGVKEKEEGMAGSVRRMQLFSDEALKSVLQSMMDDAGIRQSLAAK
jgi:hypothetical protein